MKTILLALLLAPAIAQAQAPDLHLAGFHLEKAGKLQSAAIGTTLAGLFLGTMILLNTDVSEAQTAGLAIMGISGGVSIILHFGAAKHTKLAGRLLQ